MRHPVRARRAAIVGGALVGVFVFAVFAIRTVPDRIVSLLGGPSGGVDRIGGLRVRYFASPGTEQAFAEYAKAHGGAGRFRDGALDLEFAGVSEDMAAELASVLANGGLEMKVALETLYAREIAELAGIPHELDLERERKLDGLPPPDDVVVLIEDHWRADEGDRHMTYGLRGPTRKALEETIARSGWKPPPGTEVGYERVEPWEPRGREYWRTYLLEQVALIDGNMIANATGTFEPNSGRPTVLLDFTDEGSEVFCALTKRIVGNKLATMLGGHVRSAPIIISAICGGRASITMGGTDPRGQERERDALVAFLRQGALPRGGLVEEMQWSPPADVGLQEWLGRLLLGLLGALGAGALIFGVLRFARPYRETAPPLAPGKFPVRRLAVTMLAPLLLIIAPEFSLPGINAIELEHVMQDHTGVETSVFALGITPVLFAFGLVELVALAIPPLRWRRHDPRGRRRLAQAVAVVAILIALAQGYFTTTYLEALSRGGAEVVTDPGLQFRLIAMVTLATGTLVLALIAGVITQHGLGNGYGVVIASGIAIELVPHQHLELLLEPGFWLGVLTVGVIATAAAFVLRWRVAGGEREPALRVPTSALSPLADTGAVLSLLFVVAALRGDASFYGALEWQARINADSTRLVLLAVSVPLWAWLFARPALVARQASNAGLDAPMYATWRRATVLSLLFLLGVGLLGILAVRTDATATWAAKPIEIVIATAALLDMIDDARAHHRKLVAVAAIQQVQHLGVIERLLAERGIPHHFHASHVRTLLAFFGPWAPVIVLVPEEHEGKARAAIDDVDPSGARCAPRSGAVDDVDPSGGRSIA